MTKTLQFRATISFMVALAATGVPTASSSAGSSGSALPEFDADASQGNVTIVVRHLVSGDGTYADVERDNRASGDQSQRRRTYSEYQWNTTCSEHAGDTGNIPECRYITACPEGQAFREPIGKRTVTYDPATNTTTEGPWDIWQKGACVDAAQLTPAATITPDMVREALKTIPLPKLPISHQPANYAVTGLPTFLSTTPQHIDQVVQILETPVHIKATPTSYTWDPGDGNVPITTTDPGQPYPDGHITHTYTTTADAITITLTVTWHTQYSAPGTDWRNIPDTTTTSTTTIPVKTARPILIAPNATPPPR